MTGVLRGSRVEAASEKGDSSMMNVEVRKEEVGVLTEALESYLSDLRFEILDTDKRAFRDSLKMKEDVLKTVVERLKAA
jgi:hypothetical protein